MLKLIFVLSTISSVHSGGITNPLDQHFKIVEHDNNIPQGLLASLCWIESHHKPHAINHQDGGSASLGTCQLKVGTAKMISPKITYKALLKPRTNIEIAGKYLAYQYSRYGRWDYAVAAYNSGTLNLKGATPRNIKYVRKVLNKYLTDINNNIHRQL